VEVCAGTPALAGVTGMLIVSRSMAGKAGRRN
jgi:hypothetical protein